METTTPKVGTRPRAVTSGADNHGDTVQETVLRNDEPARSGPGINQSNAGAAIPRVSVAVDDTRQARALNVVKAQVEGLNFYYGQNRALKNLSIPIADGRLTLGTWQGLYLWEHRRAAHRRTVVVHVLGES